MSKELRLTGVRIMIILLLVSMLCPQFTLATAYADEKSAAPPEETTVRVGYYPVSNYQVSNGDGTYNGFGYDYYMQIQKYTRWNYEFVEASYADCLKMIANGEIDIMGGIGKTAEREQNMLFSNSSVSSNQNKLYTRADREIYYEDYEGFEDCDVAVLKGALYDDLEEYSVLHNFKVNIVEYDTMKEMENALMSGKVDMIFGTSIAAEADTKIVARLKKLPLYYAVNKNKPEIANEMEDALQKITDNNPNFYTQMSEKYMISGANAAATFTKEELDYIDSDEKVYVIMNDNWAPISWYDSDTNTYKGIVKDVLEKISTFSGLDFEFCNEDDFNAMAKLHPEMIDNVLAILADDNTWAVAQNVMMTNHLVDASVVMVTKRGTDQGEIGEHSVIALPERFYISWRMKDLFP